MTNLRPRARDLGIVIGPFPVGPHNAITDVPGVRVGQVTLIQGEGLLRIGQGPVRTGVTAIVPPGDDWFYQPVEAGCFVFNGAGTTAGTTLIDEFGRIETPVMLTNTLSVGTVYEGVVRYMVERSFAPRGSVPWFNPVVGETSDTYLNDMGGLHVRPEHAVEAIRIATGGPVEEGCVGAGTGTSAFGFKGGIGTSSRVVEIGGEPGTIGVLVQSNFGGRLTIAGVPMDELRPAGRRRPRPSPPLAEAGGRETDALGASIMMIVATDLPLSNRLLNRVSRRATLGMARAGSSGGHGSGDYVIAFSTTYRTPGAMEATRRALAENESRIDVAFEAVADATEEAILNSLFRAQTLVGRDDNTREALPLERVMDLLRRAGRLV
jgi:D-aminopeptidase